MVRSLEDYIQSQLKKRENVHFMLVDGMSKLKTHKIKTCQSSVFHVSGLKWKLIIYPAGKDGKSDYLSYYLRIKNKKSLPSNWEVKCSLKLFVLSYNVIDIGDTTEWPVVCYNAQKAIHGKDSFMLNKNLKARTNGSSVHDIVVFGAEITDVKPNFHVTVLPRTMGSAERLNLIEMPRNNSRFTWTIRKFSSLDGEPYSSYKFTIGPRRWKLLMYPKGNLDGKGTSLSLYLHAFDYVANGPKAKTLAVYKMRVLDQLNHKHYEHNRRTWFHSDPDRSTDSSLTRSVYLPLAYLDDPSMGFLVNDKITVEVEFLFVSTTVYF